MFDKSITTSDAYLDMPVSTQNLYFHLAMEGDDDGFINSPKKIMRTIGASQDDLNILFAKKFVIPFESGVVVIKHWRIHNYIRSDRYNETLYKDEKALLEQDENGSYSLKNLNGIPVVDQRLTQVRLEEDRIGKVSIEENKTAKEIFFDNLDVQNLFEEFLKLRKKLKAQNTPRAINTLLNILKPYDDETKIKMLDNSIVSSWKSIYPITEKKSNYNSNKRTELVPTFNQEEQDVELQAEYEKVLEEMGVKQ